MPNAKDYKPCPRCKFDVRNPEIDYDRYAVGSEEHLSHMLRSFSKLVLAMRSRKTSCWCDAANNKHTQLCEEARTLSNQYILEGKARRA